MDWHTVLALVLSGAIGVSLGWLGGGGSILAVPVLVYVAGVEAKEAVAMSLAMVGATSLVASLLHQRHGRLDAKTAALFGGAGMAGAFFGAKLTPLVSSAMLLLLFAVVMLSVATLMLVHNRPDVTAGEKYAGRWRNTLLAGAGVGVVTGFLGVGGGFLIVPALVLVAGLSMHMAVGTSLLVITINAAAGFVGHLGASRVPMALTGVLTAAAVAGTFVGARIAGRLPAHGMRRAFAGFVLVVALFLIAANHRALL